MIKFCKIIFVLFWMALIFSFSMDNGDSSTVKSNTIIDIVSKFFYREEFWPVLDTHPVGSHLRFQSFYSRFKLCDSSLPIHFGSFHLSSLSPFYAIDTGKKSDYNEIADSYRKGFPSLSSALKSRLCISLSIF